MSDLSASISDFRKRLKATGSVNSRRSFPNSTVSGTNSNNNSLVTSTGTNNDGDNSSSTDYSHSQVKRLKKEEDSEYYSPVKKAKLDYVKNLEASRVAAQNDLSSSHLSTNLHLAVEVVKASDKPITLETLRQRLNTTDISKLVIALKNTDRIKYNPDKRTLEYVSLHNIKSASGLLSYLHAQTIFKGISVRDLKDGWSNCNSTINELEKKNKILVLRAKKDNTPKYVWINYRELALGAIDEDFVNMWNKVKLPSASELPLKLNEKGIKPTSVDPSTLKKANSARLQKKQKKPRKGKITNTHMKGILRDYT